MITAWASPTSPWGAAAMPDLVHKEEVAEMHTALDSGRRRDTVLVGGGSPGYMMGTSREVIDHETVEELQFIEGEMVRSYLVWVGTRTGLKGSPRDARPRAAFEAQPIHRARDPSEGEVGFAQQLGHPSVRNLFCG